MPRPAVETKTIKGEQFSFVNGERFPHVTTVTGTVMRIVELETWRGRLGNEEADKTRDEAAYFGILIHKACALAIQGKKRIDIPAEISSFVEAYLTWAEMMIEETIAVEELVINEKYGYAGTPDLIAVLKGDRLPSVIDIKTGFVGDIAKLQTAAYRACVPSGDRRIVVSLDKKKFEAKPKIIEYKNHHQDFQAFLNCLGIFRWLRSN